MSRKIIFSLGLFFILLGTLGFIASAVALANSNKFSEIENPKNIQITIDDSEPVVVERKQQATKVLFGSLLCAGTGTVLVCYRLLIQENQISQDPH